MSERDRPITPYGSGFCVQRGPDSLGCISGRPSLKVCPLRGQLDDGLPLSPQWVRSDKALQINRLFPREQVVHGAAQLVGEHGQGFGFAVFMFALQEVRFPRLTLAEEQHGGFSKGPA